MTTDDVPWCVFQGPKKGQPTDRGTLICRGCGVTDTLFLPLSVSTFVGAIRGFVESHRGCRP